MNALSSIASENFFARFAANHSLARLAKASESDAVMFQPEGSIILDMRSFVGPTGNENLMELTAPANFPPIDSV